MALTRALSPTGAAQREKPRAGERTRTSAPAPSPPLFRQRNFSALWWGQIISLLGERLTYLALLGLLSEHTHGFRVTGSSWLLSLLANVMLAPVLILAPFAGAWIDHWNLKRVVVLSDTLRALIVLLIPVFYALTGQLLPVFGLLFLLFTCGVFFLPAKSSLTLEIVPAPQLLAANTWLTAAGLIATAAGSLGGGWLIDHWGWSPVLYLNAATYAVSVIALLLIRYAPQARPSLRGATTLAGYAQQLREGWRVVQTVPALGLALTALGAVWLAGGFLHVAGNLHIQRAASVPGMERLGILMAVLGVGSGLSAWWINTGGRRVPRSRMIPGALLVAGAGLLLFAVSTAFAVFALAGLLMGLAATPAIMISETMLQESTTSGLRGRVFGTRDFLMRSVLLVSVSLAGWASRTFGPQPALFMCAALVIGTGAVALAAARRPGR